MSKVTTITVANSGIGDIHGAARESKLKGWTVIETVGGYVGDDGALVIEAGHRLEIIGTGFELSQVLEGLAVRLQREETFLVELVDADGHHAYLYHLDTGRFENI